MHQRLTADPFRTLQLYERGVLTLLGATDALIGAAITPPTAEFVTGCPAAILDRIRELTALPQGTDWLIIQCGTYPRDADPVAIEPARRNELEQWLRGLSVWRRYFEGER
jgi:hypothetical protein